MENQLNVSLTLNDSHLSVQNKVVLPEVSDSDDETESPVPHGDGGLVAEDDRLAPVPGPGELGEDQTHHEGLDDATQDSLERHDEDGVRTVCCCLPGPVPDGVLGLQRKEKYRGEPVRLGDAGKPV